MERQIASGVVAASLAVIGAADVHGQEYPNRPVRIVTAEAGSGVDLVARIIAPGLTKALRQQVLVDNRGGASGIIPIQAVAKSSPDGYTLLLYGTGMWTLPLMQNVPYDPIADFSPVTLTGISPNILVVHPSLPAKSVKELIALSKSRPGELSYSSGGAGASNHLAAELFKFMAHVDILRVPFKGAASALNGLIGGQTQLMFPAAAAAAPHIKSGRFRALAVSTARPSALAPGLPTIAASGLPGYDSAFAIGLFAPAKTPAEVTNRVYQEVIGVLETAEVKDRLFGAGTEVVASSPEELAAALKSEIAKLGNVIKSAGIRANN